MDRGQQSPLSMETCRDDTYGSMQQMERMRKSDGLSIALSCIRSTNAPAMPLVAGRCDTNPGTGREAHADNTFQSGHYS